jgi:hypothetical protein
MNSRMDRPEIFMHTSLSITENKKTLVAISAACLSFLTLGSVSVYGIPENYLVTLSTLTIIITVILIMVLWRSKP